MQSTLASSVLAFAEEAEEVPNPVIPEINEVIWAAIAFFTLWALMHFVLLPPLLRMRAEREAKMLADREAADRARSSLGQVQGEYDSALAEARAEADGIIDAARAEAGEHRAELLGEANNEIAAIRTEAATGLDSSRTQAIGSLRNDVGEIAVSAASAVLGKPVDPGAAKSAIDSALNGGDA